MAKNNINKYTDATAYDGDSNKDYPNVSYITATGEIRYVKTQPVVQPIYDYINYEGDVICSGGIAYKNMMYSVSYDGGSTWTPLEEDDPYYEMPIIGDPVPEYDSECEEPEDDSESEE